VIRKEVSLVQVIRVFDNLHGVFEKHKLFLPIRILNMAESSITTVCGDLLKVIKWLLKKDIWARLCLQIEVNLSLLCVVPVLQACMFQQQ
jgi:hypothetical protein